MLPALACEQQGAPHRCLQRKQGGQEVASVSGQAGRQAKGGRCNWQACCTLYGAHSPPADMLAPFIIITNALQAHGPTLRTLKDQGDVEAGGWQRLGRGRRRGWRRRGHPAAHGHAEPELRGGHWVAHPVDQLGDGDPVGALADAVVCRRGRNREEGDGDVGVVLSRLSTYSCCWSCTLSLSLKVPPTPTPAYNSFRHRPMPAPSYPQTARAASSAAP